MILGITGKIGSGKHAAAKFLEEQGYFLIDVDHLAHELYIRGSDVWHKLVDAFGKKIIAKDYAIDRKKLAEIVFSDSKKIKILNQLVHPSLKKAIKDKITEANIQHFEKVVIVAALADELELKTMVAKLVLISAPLEKRLVWLKNNRGLTEKEILKRNDSQKEIEVYDVEIVNEGSLEELKKQFLELV